MCFTKSAPSVVAKQEDPVVQHQANASLTKNSKSDSLSQGFNQNIKTSPFGLDEQANSQKKTLLGE